MGTPIESAGIDRAEGRRIASVLRPLLPQLSEEIVDAIRNQVEPYRRPLEGPFGRNVVLGTERALKRFLDDLTEPRSAGDRAREVYIELGRGEFRDGRSFDSLLAAYRVGARLAWRRLVEAGTAAGLEPEVLYRVGEALFAYIDELSAESIEGYAQAQSAAAGERQRYRERLIGLLRQVPAADEATVRAAAADADWALPRRVAALVVSGEERDAVAGRIGGGAIAAALGELASGARDGTSAVDGSADGEGVATLVLVPDPGAPGRLAELRAGLGSAFAALGPEVPLLATARSVERAILAHRLLIAGVLPGPLVIADEHLPALMLHADPQLSADLAARELAPLLALPERTRDKLLATLRAWLDHGGRIENVARELGVHAQTVRYRLNQLRDELGGRLDDPDGRWALATALRISQS